MSTWWPSWISFGSQGTSLKFLEKTLSSLSTPVLSALKSGFDGARSHPNVSILVSLIVATGGYFLARRYSKAKEVSTFKDINNSLGGINLLLRGIKGQLNDHASALDSHTKSLGTLAGNLLAHNEPLLSAKTSLISLERAQAENHNALLSQFRIQNNNIGALGTTLNSVKTNVEFVVAEQRARALTK